MTLTLYGLLLDCYSLIERMMYDAAFILYCSFRSHLSLQAIAQYIDIYRTLRILNYMWIVWNYITYKNKLNYKCHYVYEIVLDKRRN